MTKHYSLLTYCLEDRPHIGYSNTPISNCTDPFSLKNLLILCQITNCFNSLEPFHYFLAMIRHGMFPVKIY